MGGWNRNREHLFKTWVTRYAKTKENLAWISDKLLKVKIMKVSY